MATVALLSLVAFVHFGFLDVHSLWNNEFITLKVLRMDYGELFVERLHRNHMPVYFLILKAWTVMFGKSEIALHIPSAIFSLLGVLFVWRLGVHLFGQRMGLFVLAISGLCQVHVELSQDARMYSWLFCACAASLWAYILYLDTGRLRYLVALSLAGLAGIAVQLVYLFVPLTLLLDLCIRRKRISPPRWKAITALALPILMTLPCIIWWTAVQDKVGHAPVWRGFEPEDALRQLWAMFTGDSDDVQANWVTYLDRLLVAFCLGVVIRQLWKARKARKALPEPAEIIDSPYPHMGLLLLWSFVPVLLISIAAIRSAKQMIGSWRYYIMAAATAPLLISYAVIILRDLKRPRWMTGVIVGVLLAVSVNTVAYLAAPGPGLREIAQHIAQNIQEGDRVITSRRKTRTMAFTYYGAMNRQPDQLPPDLKQSSEIVAWVTETVSPAPRVWTVYYDGLDNKLAKALKSHPDRYTPQGDPVEVGDTAVQLFVVRNE